MSKKKRPHGHYCKIYGGYKANEKFSGKGHAAHICKSCSHLSTTEKAAVMDRKAPQDKNHLIVDEMTTPTVRLLFSLALEGYGTNRIGKVLYERKIPKLSYYKQEVFSQNDTGSND